MYIYNSTVTCNSVHTLRWTR